MRRLVWSFATLALLAALGVRWARQNRTAPPRTVETMTGRPDAPDAGQVPALDGATDSRAPAPAAPESAPRHIEPVADPAAAGTNLRSSQAGATAQTEGGLASSLGDDGCGSSPDPAQPPPSHSGPQAAMGMVSPRRPLDVLGPLEGGWTSASSSHLIYHRDVDGLIEIPGHLGAEGEAVVMYGEDGTGMWRGTIDGADVLEHIVFDRVEDLPSPPGATRVVFLRDGPGPVDSIELEIDGKDALLWSVTRNGKVGAVRYWRHGP